MENLHLARKPVTPIIWLTVVCALVAVWSVFSTGLIGADAQHVPLILSGVLLGFISIFEIRIGLAILLLAIGLSPEFELWGIPNFRYEDLVFPILFFVWITKHTLTKQRFATTNLKLPLLIIVFISLVSSLNNHIYEGLDMRTAVLKFGKSVEYYFIFVIVLNSLRSRRDLHAFIQLMIITSAFVGVYGITQFGLDSGSVGFRVSGPPGETANILGGYYLFHICLAMGLLAHAKPSTRALLIIYLLVMIFPFVQTLSRTSYVALLVGFLVIAFMSRNRILGWMLLVLAMVSLLSPDNVVDRFLSIFGIFSGELPSSFEARVAGWKLFSAYAMNAPLLGRGVGTAQLGHVDSEYLLQLHELGLIGLMAFLWMITKCLRTSYQLKGVRREEGADSMLSGFSLGYFGGCLALMVHSIGATTFTTIRTTEPFFFATGILYVYWNMTRKTRTRHHDSIPVAGPAPRIGHPEGPGLSAFGGRIGSRPDPD